MPTSFSTIPTTTTSVPPDATEPPQYDDPLPAEPSQAEPPAPPDRDLREHWHDGGDSWWAPHPVPPSYRDPQ